MPDLVNSCTTLAARAADSSQFDGNAEVRIGRSSVWPSTRIGLGKGLSTCANLSSTGAAVEAKPPEPLGNRMSVLISTSSHRLSRRTVTRWASISACMASCTSRSMRTSDPGALPPAGLAASALAASDWGIALAIEPAPSRRCSIFMSTVGVTPVSCLSPPLPDSLSPMLIGRTDFGAPWNAAISESDNTRNLPSFTDDMAYMTVNRANSSVTRSP